ncbi:MAG: sugar phosphate isomerase/epimerase family protein [Acidimicrobiales bacterium]
MEWHPRISVDEVCAGPIPFDEEVGFWNELGVKTIGMVFTKLEPIGWDAELVRRTGLRVSNVVCAERIAFEALEFGAAMGSDLVWLGSTGSIGSRFWEEAADDFCERIAPAVTRAGELGVPFAIQPTNSLRLDISFLYTFRDALTIARAIGSGVVLELECCWYEPGLKKLVRDNIESITLVQIDDVTIGDTWSPNRSVIGDGHMPLERLLAMILEAGYEGMFDLELIGPRIDAEGHLSATRRSLERASEILGRIGA